MQSKSCQVPKEMTERQNWIQDKFNFLKMHLKCKGFSKSSFLKSPARGVSASAASACNICRGSTDMDSMEISMPPQCSLQLQAPVQFLCVLWSRSRSWSYFHTDPNEALQPTGSSADEELETKTRMWCQPMNDLTSLSVYNSGPLKQTVRYPSYPGLTIHPLCPRHRGVECSVSCIAISVSESIS